MRYDVALRRPEQDKLVEILALSSYRLPWVGDLDEDAEAEVVTWRARELSVAWEVVPWPIVHTLVAGRWAVRTGQFPALFPPIVRFLLEQERRYPSDSMVPRYLAEAYEILEDEDAAIAAYRRAERKCRTAAAYRAMDGRLDEARRYKRTAVALRDRLRQLLAAEGNHRTEARRTH